jgi:protein phosphatase
VRHRHAFLRRSAAAPLAWAELPAPEADGPVGWGATDRGRHRAKNEDAFAIAPLANGDGLLLVVADGLGGQHGGEVASRIAVDVVRDRVTRRPLSSDDNVPRALRRAVEHAGRALEETARERPELARFGTTLTAAVIAGEDLWVAHVGDSRAYLWRGGRLERLTRDHTMAERLREEGLVPSRRKVPSWESVLWNALGPSGEQTHVEERHDRLEPGDGLLLCSDGLTRHLRDEELAKRLARRAPSRELCDELVGAANRAGGEDNITVVLAKALPSSRLS